MIVVVWGFESWISTYLSLPQNGVIDYNQASQVTVGEVQPEVNC